MFALVVNTENEMHLRAYDPPDYDVIRDAVGGWYELVRPMGLKPPYLMMVNEDGLRLGLSMNRLGSLLYGTHLHGHPIVGNIVFLKDGHFGGERDAVGMAEDEALRLGDEFVNRTGGIVRWGHN